MARISMHTWDPFLSRPELPRGVQRTESLGWAKGQRASMALGCGSHTPGQVRVGGKGARRHQLRKWEACPGGGPREDTVVPNLMLRSTGASCELWGLGQGKARKLFPSSCVDGGGEYGLRTAGDTGQNHQVEV